TSAISNAWEARKALANLRTTIQKQTKLLRDNGNSEDAQDLEEMITRKPLSEKDSGGLDHQIDKLDKLLKGGNDNQFLQEIIDKNGSLEQILSFNTALQQTKHARDVLQYRISGDENVVTFDKVDGKNVQVFPLATDRQRFADATLRIPVSDKETITLYELKAKLEKEGDDWLNLGFWLTKGI
ncbi:MAG: hypothetical protein HY711_07840, partial [Candidatus Melainabacteria bacterium]|nr:hypothetical protein [Candidatus Melainabacteria bacterium]